MARRKWERLFLPSSGCLGMFPLNFEECLKAFFLGRCCFSSADLRCRLQGNANMSIWPFHNGTCKSTPSVQASAGFQVWEWVFLEGAPYLFGLSFIGRPRGTPFLRVSLLSTPTFRHQTHTKPMIRGDQLQTSQSGQSLGHVAVYCLTPPSWRCLSGHRKDHRTNWLRSPSALDTLQIHTHV